MDINPVNQKITPLNIQVDQTKTEILPSEGQIP
jgi:hypothetical protein